MATMNLELKNITVMLGKFRLSIPEMSISSNTVGISGPNGSGKSTLLRLINGLIVPNEGTVRINGIDIHSLPPLKRARLISYLPQETPSPFAFRALDVVKLSGYSNDEDEKRALDCMEMLEVKHLAGRNFNSLSGGEKRLVMLSGQIYQDSDIVLLDEPETYLDIKHRLILRRAVNSMIDSGKSVITVLHSLEGLSKNNDVTVLMREGNVIHFGPTSDVINEDNLRDTFSVGFLKDMNSMEERYIAFEEP